MATIEPIEAVGTVLAQGATYEEQLKALLNTAKEQSARIVDVRGVPLLLCSTSDGDGNIEFGAESIKALLDEYAVKPDRRTGTAALRRIDSFVEHVNRFKSEHSALFAVPDDSNARVFCVFDYNPAGPDNASAAFGKHRASYTFQISKEWAVWSSVFGKDLTVQKFAELIEDRLLDIDDLKGTDPNTSRAWDFAEKLSTRIATAAEMLELSRGMAVNVKMRVSHVTRLSSNERRMHLETEHQGPDGAQLNVPGAFAIAIPVFEGGDPYRLPIRIRYEVSEQKLITWKLLPHREDLSFKDAFDRAIAKVKEGTQLPLFYGTPE